MYCSHYEAGLFTFVETLSGSSKIVPIGEALESGDEMLPTAPGVSLPLPIFPIYLISLSQAALAQTNVSGPEWQVAQAMAIKEVVSSHASQHGSDLLPLLSNLINQVCSPLDNLTAPSNKLNVDNISNLPGGGGGGRHSSQLGS